MIDAKYKKPLTLAAVIIVAIVAYGAMTMNGRSLSERFGDAAKDTESTMKDTTNP